MRQRQPDPESRAGSFDLKILNLNVWGLKLADLKNERMPAIAKMLKNSDYDVVLVQEAWYNVDYHLLAATFPHVTNYGTPGSNNSSLRILELTPYKTIVTVPKGNFPCMYQLHHYSGCI